MTEKIYIQFAENRIGTELMIRKWQSTPFEGGEKYTRSPQPSAGVQEVTWQQFSDVAAEWSQHHSKEFPTLAAYYEHKFPNGLKIVADDGGK